MKFLIFLFITPLLCLMGHSQCSPTLLGTRGEGNMEEGIRLSSPDLDNAFLNQAGDRWNSCGTGISSSFGQIPVQVFVIDEIGTSIFRGTVSGGQLTGGIIEIYAQYNTGCCGVQTRTPDDINDALTHELGHALGLANTNCTGSDIMKRAGVFR